MRFIWLLLIVSLLSSAGYACSCIPPAPPVEAMADSDAVFSGRVLSVEVPRYFQSTAEESVKVKFDVSEVWKGDVSKTVTVRTAQSSASCGYEFQAGEQYIVYSDTKEGEGDDLFVSLCSRTALLHDAPEDVAALGDGTKPEPVALPLLVRIWNWIMGIFGVQ